MLRDNRSFPHLRSRPGPLSTFSTGSSSVYSQWNALRYATRVSSFSTQFNLHQLLKCLKTGEPLRVFSHLYWIITTCSKKQVMDANIIESPKYNALSACLWNMKTQITFKRIHPNISLIAKKKERLMTEQDGQKNLNLAFTKYFC